LLNGRGRFWRLGLIQKYYGHLAGNINIILQYYNNVKTRLLIKQADYADLQIYFQSNKFDLVKIYHTTFDI